MENFPSSKSIFVGNIPYNYDVQSLQETLSMVGPINNFRIVNDDSTGKSKGYGFCEYKNSEIASSALRNLKTIDYNGRQLRVNTAENDKSGLYITEDMVKASRDLSYIKGSDNSMEFSDLLKNLTDEQKLLMFHTFKNMNDTQGAEFRNLLMNQSEEFLNAILEAQLSYLNKFSGGQKHSSNKIV